MNSKEWKNKFFEMTGHKELLIQKLNDGLFAASEWEAIIDEMREYKFYAMANDLEERMANYRAKWIIEKPEFSTYKSVMFNAAEISDRLSKRDVNVAINESTKTALDDLPKKQAAIVRREAEHLMDCIETLGEAGALEVIASISEFV